MTLHKTLATNSVSELLNVSFISCRIALSLDYLTEQFISNLEEQYL